MGENLKDLSNIDVFALCVAAIMNRLYQAFPLDDKVCSYDVVVHFEAPEELRKPRLVLPNDIDYRDLLRYGYSVSADAAHATSEEFNEEMLARDGEPFQFWSVEQKKAIKENKDRAKDVEQIYEATVRFLTREGYIAVFRKDVEERELLSLTSKGFAHLHKRFADGTIQDEFHHHALKSLATGVERTGSAVVAFSNLVHIVAKFFGT